ncbi:MAG: alpha/beta fold hydrolase [Polyangiales bacterium]
MTHNHPLTTAIAEKVIDAPDGRVSILRATPASPRGVALLLPAMGVAAGYYAKFAETLAEQGMAAAVLERRGEGEHETKPARGVDFGYQELLGDLDLALHSLRNEYPGLPVILVGHSIGGHLAMLQLALKPESIDAVALIATATPHHAPYEGAARWKVRLGTRMIRVVSSVMGYYPGHRIGFGGLQPKTLMREWTDMARSGRYALQGSSLDIEAALKDLSIPALALVIDGDEVAPPRACEPIANKLPKDQVDWVVLGAPRMSARACHHQRWAREPTPVVEEIVAFVDRRIPARGRVTVDSDQAKVAGARRR